MNNYFLAFKTGDAEFRALEHSSEKDFIVPIVELTKSRRTKKDPIGKVGKRLGQISSLFFDKKVILDITTEATQKNSETESFYECQNGYSNWTSFLEKLKNEPGWTLLIPTILVNTEDENFDDNLSVEVKTLSNDFQSIAYRHPLNDDGYLDDLQIISENISENTELYFIVDCGYIPRGVLPNTQDKVAAQLKKIQAVSLKCNINLILLATSFPNNLSEIFKNDSGELPIFEIDLYQNLKKSFLNLNYGDYGSTNPIRNDEVIMARGWRPRIDVPFLYKDKMSLYFIRKKKNNGYAETYVSVANEIIKDERFPSFLKNNWGVKKIIETAEGNVAGASPNFWISVRMSIFLEQQINRLKRNFNPDV